MPSSASREPSEKPVERLPFNGASHTDDVPTIVSRRKSIGLDVDDMRGRRLAHYEIIEPIGIGGMGAVLKAVDLTLGRTVALKVLPPDLANDDEHLQRFQLEARAAARLDHENIAQVYYCGADSGLHFIAFEYVDGEDLKTLLARSGPPPVDVAIRTMLQIARGLAHAASRGVIHRDIKPSNVIVTAHGKAKIVDMGLARLEGPADGVTRSGATLGTYDYISPEQALEPRSADSRSDIYSLGCTFYHWLTGHSPVPDGTAAKKLHFHQSMQPADPRFYNRSLSDNLVDVLGRMMAKDPMDRYQSPDELVNDLQSISHEMQMGRTEKVAKNEARYLRRTVSTTVPRWLVLGSIFAVILLIGVLEWVFAPQLRSRPLDESRPTLNVPLSTEPSSIP